MTSITHHDADQFLAEPIGNYFLFLVFGSDQGLIFERCRKLIRSAIGTAGDVLQIVEISGDSIAADPLSLVDEANAINMFGGTVRVIRVLTGKSSILPALELVAQPPPSDCIIIVEGGELKRDSPLRKWVEAQSFAVSIECRADEAKDIQRLIDTELRTAKLSIDPDAREALGSMLGEDRLTTRSELEKLTLYTHDRSPINITHINEILHDASALGIDFVISALFSGRSTHVILLINKAIQTGVDINVLLAAAMRYALAIHRCRCDIDCGVSFDASFQTLLRQVYGYNRKSEIAVHLREIPLVTLERILASIFESIKATRQNTSLSEQRVIRLFLHLTALIRRSQ